MPRYSLLWRERWFQHWRTQYWETEELSRKSRLLCEVFGLSDGTKRLSSLHSQERVSDAWNPNAGEGTFYPEVHFLPVVYKGNLYDGLEVKSILSIIASNDGPCFFFPSLLYMIEWSFWTSLWRKPCNFDCLRFLVNFLSFNFSCKALQFFFFAERKSQYSCTCYGNVFSRNTHNGAYQTFLQAFQKSARKDSQKPPQY